MDKDELAAFFDESLGEAHAQVERENYVRAPFGWAGGKWRSLSNIIPILPYRRTWIDGCGGSGVVSLNRRESELEIFNDRNTGVVSFFRAIREPAKNAAMMAWLEHAIHSREEFIWCRDSWKNCTDDVERACRWYYMIRMSFGQLGRNFGRATDSKPQQPGSVQKSLPLFPLISSRFRNFQIENMDVIQVIRDYDEHRTVGYIDPDYLNVNSGIYSDSVNHSLLLETIFNSKGFYAVSGYPNSLYENRKWDERLEWEAHVSMTSQAFTEENHLADKQYSMTRETKAKEVLWIKG